jgi:two-component system, NtrC family, response regulator HydG
MSDQLNILIVDDDIDNAQSLAELFELEGHLATMVHNGDDAISAYLNGTFDLAFMDVMMPGKNGVESFLEIKRVKPNAKIVMMTGYSVEQLLQQAIENGAMGVLTKPMEPKRILQVIADVGPKGIVVAQSDKYRSSDDVKDVLTLAGHQCRVATSSQEAMQMATPDAKDILIVDLHKPLIDGFSVYTEMKKAGVCQRTIIMTDNNEGGVKPHELLRDLPTTGILNKPFDPSALLMHLKRLVA